MIGEEEEEKRRAELTGCTFMAGVECCAVKSLVGGLDDQGEWFGSDIVVARLSKDRSRRESEERGEESGLHDDDGLFFSCKRMYWLGGNYCASVKKDLKAVLMMIEVFLLTGNTGPSYTTTLRSFLSPPTMFVNKMSNTVKAICNARRRST